MADVTGPISSLPYSSHCSPKDAKCDEHPDRPAVARVQGETDSFGSEMHDCCQQCLDEIKRERLEARERLSFCDYCKQETKGCAPMRDYDEGMCGPIYNVCPACRKKVNDEAREEMEAMDHSGDLEDGAFDDEPYYPYDDLEDAHDAVGEEEQHDAHVIRFRAYERVWIERDYQHAGEEQ